MGKVTLKKTLVSLLILITVNANAAFSRNGFLVTEENLDFSKTIRSGVCEGVVPYPVLSNGDEELIAEINDEIHDFVELYAICNQGRRDHFAVHFDIPESGTKEYFSTRWITKRNNKVWRIDVLNFNRDTGAILKIDNVFNMLSNNMMGEMIKLSDNHLSRSCDWECFLGKVEKKEIQFYLEKKQWFIVFNATPSSNRVTDVKIPTYFLKGGDHDRG